MQLLILILILALSPHGLSAANYQLSDGSSVSGDPVSYNEIGVVLKTPEGAFRERVAWSKFSQEALKTLASEAKRPQDAAHVVPYLQESLQTTSQRTPLKLNPVPKVDLPKGKLGLINLTHSSIGMLLLLAVFGANLYAAYQVALFRGHPAKVVLASAVLLPWIAPLIWLAIERKLPDYDAVPSASTRAPAPAIPSFRPHTPTARAPVASAPVAPVEAEPQPEAPTTYAATTPPLEEAPVAAVPEPVVYGRGDFTFNKRFFETRLPGFFRVILPEADREKVIVIKSSRGSFVGKRITQINQNELYLQVFKGDVTADEMIPFSEVNEVTVAHQSLIS